MTTATHDLTTPMTMPSAATAAKLVAPRAEALAHLSAHLQKGITIAASRIKYPEDLDRARSLKLEWTQVMNDLLNQLFDNSSVADYCNDWVGKIFPEYAEFGNFVEQFYEEMHQRIARLQSVVERLNMIADPAPIPSSMPAPTIAGPAAPPVAPVMAAPSATFNGPYRGAGRKVKAVLATDGHPTPYGEAVAKFMEQLGMAVVKVAAATSLVDVMAKEADTTFVAMLLDSGDASHGQGDAPPRDDRGLLFELGFCAGRVGAQRVCILQPTGAAPIVGAGTIEHLGLDASGGWQLQLARLMKRCGIEVDLNKLC